MNVLCMLYSHATPEPGVWNEGYCFSHCARCRCDLMRTSGRWQSLPHGYRVAWRTGQHAHAIPSDLRRNLPLVVNRRFSRNVAWKLGLHRKGVGCIMLPADAAYGAEPPMHDNALAATVITVLTVALQAMLLTTLRAPTAAGVRTSLA